jgi:hypothetical protein
VEASRWVMAPLRELLSWQWIQVRVYCLTEFLIDLTHKFQYLSSNVRNLTEEMV